MSALNIGMPTENIFGFDIVTTEKYIMFSMKKGWSIEEYLAKKIGDFQVNSVIEHAFKDLGQALYLMHMLNICHNDIKPANILYNPSKKKLVFIDFGLSEVKEEEIGQLNYTHGKGSLIYCCSQMR